MGPQERERSTKMESNSSGKNNRRTFEQEIIAFPLFL